VPPTHGAVRATKEQAYMWSTQGGGKATLAAPCRARKRDDSMLVGAVWQAVFLIDASEAWADRQSRPYATLRKPASYRLLYYDITT